jgi:hypothetical protein
MKSSGRAQIFALFIQRMLLSPVKCHQPAPLPNGSAKRIVLALGAVFHRLFFLYHSNGHSRDSLLVRPFLPARVLGLRRKEEQMTETIDDRER